MPVGNYFKGGLAPTNFIVSEAFDRAAPYGTGAAKVGGNYAGSLLPGRAAKSAGFSDVIYLDPATHTKIEEVGAANFLALLKIMNLLRHLVHPSCHLLRSIHSYN